jgi:multiple RNA-binding domain-containing protein 1
LKEFLEVMQAPSKSKAWANDDALGLGSEPTPAADVVQKAPVAEDESDREYQVISKKSKTSQELTGPSSRPEPVPKTVEVSKIAMEEVSSREEVPDPLLSENAPVSDGDWLRSRTNRVLDLVDDDDKPARPIIQEHSHSQEDHNTVNAPVAEAEQPEPTNTEDVEMIDAAPSEEDKVRQSGRLYLRNLHFDTTSDDLRDHFSKHGPLEEVRNVVSYPLSFPTCNDEQPDRDN